MTVNNNKNRRRSHRAPPLGGAKKTDTTIPCLVPDLPGVDELVPLLGEIDSNRWYTNFGPLQGRFEAALSSYCAAAQAQLHTVTFSSATQALSLALRAMRLQEGARVLVPAFTFPATLLAVLEARLVPVLVDVDPGSWALEPDMAEQALRGTPCEAVIPVTPFGYPACLSSWAQFQAKTGVRVLVDAAGALGVQQVDGCVPVVFSLHATKPLGSGEGGVLVTGDGQLAAAARRLSNFGFIHGEIRHAGTNAKLSEYHAAVGLAQLARADQVLERRRSVLAEYCRLLPPGLLRGSPGADGEYPPPANLAVHLKGRAAEVNDYLVQRGIECRRWYYPPLHRHPAFRRLQRAVSGSGRLRHTDYLGRSLLGLPFHGFLTSRQVNHVARTLLALLQGDD